MSESQDIKLWFGQRLLSWRPVEKDFLMQAEEPSKVLSNKYRQYSHA